MVQDILERRLIVLFIEGLVEPLRGWVKAFDPYTLKETMKKARDMEHTVLVNKFQSKGASTSKDSKPFFKKPDGTD